MNFLEIWYEMCQKTQIWPKRGKNIRHFIWSPKYILLFPATLNHYKSSALAAVVSLSVYPHVLVQTHKMDLLDISYLELIWKYVWKIPNLVKIKWKYWTLYTKT